MHSPCHLNNFRAAAFAALQTAVLDAHRSAAARKPSTQLCLPGFRGQELENEGRDDLEHFINTRIIRGVCVENMPKSSRPCFAMCRPCAAAAKQLWGSSPRPYGLAPALDHCVPALPWTLPAILTISELQPSQLCRPAPSRSCSPPAGSLTRSSAQPSRRSSVCRAFGARNWRMKGGMI